MFLFDCVRQLHCVLWNYITWGLTKSLIWQHVRPSFNEEERIEGMHIALVSSYVSNVDLSSPLLFKHQLSATEVCDYKSWSKETTMKGS